MITHFPCSV